MRCSRVCLWAVGLCAVAGATTRGVDAPGGPGPTVVTVALWVVDVDRIDSVRQTFSAQVFIGLRWRDPRLADPAAGLRTMPAADVWTPNATIVNQTGGVRKLLPDTVFVEPDGSVLQRQGYLGEFSQPLDLRDFPFDRQVFRLHLVALTARLEEQVSFVPEPSWVGRGMRDAAGMAPDLSLPDWRMVDVHARPTPYTLVPGVAAPGYALELRAVREAPYYVWKVIVPLFLIVLMSWSVLFVDPKVSGPRMGIATTSMLTLIAYRFAIDAQVPRVSYMTRLDLFVITSTVLVFLMLVQAVVLDVLFRAGHEAGALAVHRASRITVPLAFTVAAAWALLG